MICPSMHIPTSTELTELLYMSQKITAPPFGASFCCLPLPAATDHNTDGLKDSEMFQHYYIHAVYKILKEDVPQYRRSQETKNAIK